MTAALRHIPDPHAGKAASRFFLRVGQIGRATEDHNQTLPLFPLPLIMDAEGTLAADAWHLVRNTDPETSRVAADRTIEFRGKHASAIYCWLADHSAGGTFHEISKGVGIEAVAVARRLAELRTTAGVYDSGETRSTPTGRRAIVWRIDLRRAE